MKYVIAHVLGTSGNKATLFSEEGKPIGSTVYNYGCHYFNDNWAEQNPDDWWRSICDTTRGLIAKTGVDKRDIAAVSFSGQMMGCLCVDKHGTPLRPSIIWPTSAPRPSRAPSPSTSRCPTTTASSAIATPPATACRS